MRTIGVCSVLSLVAFAVTGYQIGFIKLRTSSGKIISAVPEVNLEKPKARFPQDLAPAARAQAVSQAADLDTSGKPIRMVIMETNGALHPWQEKIPEEWLADSVEATQVVVVVGGQKKTLLSTPENPNGAPAVARFQYVLEASIVEAKTGTVLANRLFQNTPRLWTTLGEPVTFLTVFNWTIALAKIGFPNEPDSGPQTTVVGD